VTSYNGNAGAEILHNYLTRCDSAKTDNRQSLARDLFSL
jgi:hypothetical protein